jgi:hypothetical protein
MLIDWLVIINLIQRNSNHKCYNRNSQHSIPELQIDPHFAVWLHALRWCTPLFLSIWSWLSNERCSFLLLITFAELNCLEQSTCEPSTQLVKKLCAFCGMTAVHYSVCKNPSMSQVTLFTHLPYLFKIHSNSILSSILVSRNWAFLVFRQKICSHFSYCSQNYHRIMLYHTLACRLM